MALEDSARDVISVWCPVAEPSNLCFCYSLLSMIANLPGWIQHYVATQYKPTPPLKMKRSRLSNLAPHGGIANRAGAMSSKVRFAVNRPEQCQALAKTLPQADILRLILRGTFK